MLTDIFVYFAHAAVIVFGALTLLWALSVALKDASLVDIFWGFGFLLVATASLYIVPEKTDYLILLAALPIIGGFASRFIWPNEISATARINATSP